MGLHGVIRATEDVDLLLRATLDNIERLRRALREVYPDDPLIDEITAGDLLGEYPAVRYYPPNGDLYFDVMTRLGEAARFETVASEVKVVDGIAFRSPRRPPCTGSNGIHCGLWTVRTLPRSGNASI